MTELQNGVIYTMEKETIDKNTILFMRLVLTFQNAAWQQMGKLANPITGQTERDLEQAMYSIDTLDMLSAKCKGNLSTEEEKYLNHIISELKLNYIDESNRPEPKGDSEEEKHEQDESASTEDENITE